jgi:hypothetical protein
MPVDFWVNANNSLLGMFLTGMPTCAVLENVGYFIGISQSLPWHLKEESISLVQPCQFSS